MKRDRIAELEARYYEFRRTARIIEREVKSFGLTHAQYQALLVIYGHPSGKSQLSVGEIARRLCLHPNSAGELLRRLEAKGLVRSRVSEADRRTRLYSLTDEGYLRFNLAARRIRAVLGADLYLASTGPSGAG